LQIKIPVKNWFGNIIQSFITSYSQETLFKVITDLDGFWNFFFWSHEKHDNEQANMAILMLSLNGFEPSFVSDVTSLSAMLVFSLTIHVL
jgi:ribosome-associated toxin RatA of RatAB toxin-antitoxin module